MNINTGRDSALTKIDIVEKKYNAKWVGQLCLKDKNGQWAEHGTADIYFQEVPPVAGYSQYFALLIQQGSLYITSGESAVAGTFTGVVADDGEVIYSRSRHDMRSSTDKSVWIDGGRDYVRTSAGAKLVQLEVKNGVIQPVV